MMMIGGILIRFSLFVSMRMCSNDVKELASCSYAGNLSGECEHAVFLFDHMC